MSKIACRLCPHHCKLDEAEVGFCRARINRSDIIEDLNYGVVTAIALDPIEKKPLRHFVKTTKYRWPEWKPPMVAG